MANTYVCFGALSPNHSVFLDFPYVCFQTRGDFRMGDRTTQRRMDFLHGLQVEDKSHSEWACQIENRKTVKATVNFGYLESRPKITEQEYQHLRDENRRKYCVKADRGKPSSDSGNGGTPQDPSDQPPGRETPDVGGWDDSVWE
jgi:hypothetical protein